MLPREIGWNQTMAPVQAIDRGVMTADEGSEAETRSLRSLVVGSRATISWNYQEKGENREQPWLHLTVHERVGISGTI